MRHDLPRGVRIDPISRFWRKVDKKGEDECWNWLGGKREGYGLVSYKGFKGHATHVAWMLTYGTYPTKDMCHTCDNPACVNPNHLFEGTHSENILDAVKKERAVKFKHEVINRIRELKNAGMSQADIVKETGVSHSHVSRVINQRRRKS